MISHFFTAPFVVRSLSPSFLHIVKDMVDRTEDKAAFETVTGSGAITAL